jgi:uncharacterized membrane protein (DUF106 family)
MAKKRAKKAKRGLRMDIMKRAASQRVKKLQANISTRNKAIKKAKARGDKSAVKDHREKQDRARKMIRELKGVMKMFSDTCPFLVQGDPTVS